MKETLKTIAARTGYSVSTVSRVLNGIGKESRISPDAIREIKKDAKKCGYNPIHLDKRLHSGKNLTIGLMVPSLKNPFFAEVAAGVILESSKRGFTTIVIDTMEDEDAFQQGISTLLHKKVDGILAVPCNNDASTLEQLDHKLIPVVLIDRFYRDCSLSYVTTNNYQGGLLATNYLIENGHRDIACIQGVKSSLPNTDRVNGYKKAMEDAGLGSRIIVIGDDFTTENGYGCARDLLHSLYRPTAIFALSGTLMLGALQAIREKGLRIPDDISIISFDDYFYLDYLEQPITRIRQPIEEMCILSVDILLKKIEDHRATSSQVRLSPTLKVGKSVIPISREL